MTPQASIAPFTAGTRTCLSCGEPLPRYHRGETCRRCQEQPPGPDDLDREIAEAERTMEDRGEKTLKGAIVKGFKLVPAAYPTKYGRPLWELVIEEFLSAGLDRARVDCPNGTAAKTMYSGMVKALRKLGESRCKASVRGEHCYLLRVAP